MTPTAFIIHEDDKPRKSLARMLEPIRVRVEVHHSARAFLDGFDHGRPGCVVCDAGLSEMDALELQARLRADGAGIPVLLLIARGDVRTAVRAIQGGAFDVLEKPVAAEALRDSVRSAIAAESTRLPALAERRAAARRLGTLTDREREVMGLLIDGLSAPAIANRLGVHPKTAEAHRSNILRKLELKSMPELIRFSLRHRPRPILYRRESGQRGDAAG